MCRPFHVPAIYNPQRATIDSIFYIRRSAFSVAVLLLLLLDYLNIHWVCLAWNPIDVRLFTFVYPSCHCKMNLKEQKWNWHFAFETKYIKIDIIGFTSALSFHWTIYNRYILTRPLFRKITTSWKASIESRMRPFGIIWVIYCNYVNCKRAANVIETRINFHFKSEKLFSNIRKILNNFFLKTISAKI